MAERKQAPVDAPVEPRTRRGRRKMDDVQIESVASKAKFDEQQRQAAIKRRAKTASMSEQEKQDALKTKKRAAQWKRTKERGSSAARVAMVVVPITAPMAVAWTGQSGFAIAVLGWSFLASLLYAAAYELVTVFMAWMYHEARKDGDNGWEYRILTWLFAAGSGTQQWWHYSDNWHATPRSVTYSTMTAVGVVVWEAYARLIHRRKLRADGKLTGARPRIGLARWVRYPRISWNAWSVAVRDNLTTIDQLWDLAKAEVERTRSEDDRVADLKKQLRDLKKQMDPKPVRAEIERTPAPISPDLAGPQPERKALEAGPQPTSPVIVAGPRATSDDEDEGEFAPTPGEIQALAEMADARVRINRGSVAAYVREHRERLNQPEGIATKRAAQVAAWGRENNGEVTLKAVGE